MPEIILLNKPFNCLSQFSDCENKTTLGHVFDGKIAKNFYPAGRLDYDSEGLLLLVNSGELQNRIANPEQKMEKTYWVQVEGVPTSEALNKLRNGVQLKDGDTKPAKAKLIHEPNLWARNPPIRKRENIPTQWLELTIAEGKNRQVRRMTAAIGHPTLRLVRASIGPWQLGKLMPGEFTQQHVNLPAPKNKARSNSKKNRTPSKTFNRRK